MIIIVLAILILVIYILAVYNIIIKQLNSVKHSKSSIEVYLNQRFDLIPNLIRCVKEYTNYEEILFEKIAKLRTDYMKDKELIKGGLLDTEINKTNNTINIFPNNILANVFKFSTEEFFKMEEQ